MVSPNTVIPINIDNSKYCNTNGTYDKLYPCFIINDNVCEVKLNNSKISIPVIQSSEGELESVGGIKGSGSELDKKEYPIFNYTPVIPMSPENTQLLGSATGFSICTPDRYAWVKFSILITDTNDIDSLPLNYIYTYRSRNEMKFGQLKIVKNTRVFETIQDPNIFTGHIYTFNNNSYEYVEENRVFDPSEKEVICWNIALI